MTTTSHLGVTLLEQAQAQKEVTVNEALTRIDAILNTGAVSQAVSTPPGSPAAGAIYIIGALPTGSWSGKARQLAYFDQIWRFVVPNEGMSMWVNDEDLLYSYDGTDWVVPSGSGTGTVTSVSVTTANGVSGSVATATTTPAITLTLGAITPSSVTASGAITGSNLSGTNTGDQTITLTGNVTGSGTGSFATTIANNSVTNAMLAGSIDLTTKVTGILPAANGGTANGFTAFSGPATSTKTFTLPNASDSIACLGQANAFTKQQYFAQTTLTDASSISWDASTNQAATVTLGGNRTLSNPTNLQAGASYTLIVKQDGTGSRTLAYDSAYKWPSGTAPVLTTTANATDILTFITDGTNMYGVAQKGFA
jgi:hypothetical protein